METLDFDYLLLKSLFVQQLEKKEFNKLTKVSMSTMLHTSKFVTCFSKYKI